MTNWVRHKCISRQYKWQCLIRQMIPDIRIFSVRRVSLEIMLMSSSIWLHQNTHTHKYVTRPHLFVTNYAVGPVYCMPFSEEHVTDTRRDARPMPVFTRAHHKYEVLKRNGVTNLRCAPRHDGWLSAFLLKSKTYYMYHQVNIRKLCVLPTMRLCSLHGSQNKQRLFLYTVLT
jgi:hypothetical protein